MQLHAPSVLRRAALITGCCALLGGCSRVHSSLTPGGNAPWTTEFGEAQTAEASLPPEAAALGHFLVAQIALQRGDYDGATRAYEQAVAADPGSALLRHRLAGLYLRANRLNDALSEAQAGVELDPQDAQLNLLLAGILSAAGRDAEAARQYEEALALDPRNEETSLMLAALWAKQGEFGRASQVLEQWIRINPNSFLGYYYLGRVHAAAREFALAELAYAEALGPTLPETERTRRQRELVEQDRDLQRNQREFQEDLNQRRNKETAGLVERANKVIKQTAGLVERANKVIKQIFDSEKYDLILQDVVFAGPRIDISDKVIKALNAAAPPAGR